MNGRKARLLRKLSEVENNRAVNREYEAMKSGSKKYFSHVINPTDKTLDTYEHTRESGYLLSKDTNRRIYRAMKKDYNQFPQVRVEIKKLQ